MELVEFQALKIGNSMAWPPLDLVLKQRGRASFLKRDAERVESLLKGWPRTEGLWWAGMRPVVTEPWVCVENMGRGEIWRVVFAPMRA